MPIGIVSDDDFAAEIERLRAPRLPTIVPNTKEESTLIEPKEVEQQQPEIKTIERGRASNDVEVPESLRSLIGITAIESGRAEALALAREFGISPSSVSAYTNGATSTASYHSPDPPLKKKINNTKERLARVARNKLGLSLKHITEDKLAGAKLRDVAAVAANMSAVIRHLEPEKESGNSNINIVLYAPKIKSESAYEVVEGELSE